MGRETKFCHSVHRYYFYSRDQQANIKIVNKEINSNLSLKYNIEQTQFLDRKSALKKITAEIYQHQRLTIGISYEIWPQCHAIA